MDDDITRLFSQGVDAYWSGDLPENWNSEEARAVSPYLMGWWFASMWETDPGYLVDEDGEPLQEV